MSLKYKRSFLFGGLAFCLGMTSSWAQSLKLGEADVIPTVKFEYLTNSNAYLTNPDQITATGVRVLPNISLVADKRLLRVEVGYLGDFASFSEDVLTYDDHEVYASVDVEFNSRSRASLNAGIQKSHEEYGTGRTFGETTGEAVEYVDSNLDGSYTFGATTARGNLTGGLLLKNISYNNRSDLTAGADTTEVTPYGRFSYRLTPRARAIFELRYRSLDFDASTTDRTEIQALSGFQIRQGGKTSGELQIGVGRANYIDASIADTSYLVVNTNLAYSPSAKANFLFELARQLDDTDGAGVTQDQAQTIKDTARITWNHTWNSFLSSKATIGVEIQENDCPAVGQSTLNSGFEIAYGFRRWLQFGVGVAHEARSADNCPGLVISADADYDRQILSVFTKISL